MLRIFKNERGIYLKRESRDKKCECSYNADKRRVNNVEVKKTKDYPIDAVYGKLLKNPKEMSDVRNQVTADYQAQLEKQWIAELRKKYTVEVYPEIVATVNKEK